MKFLLHPDDYSLEKVNNAEAKVLASKGHFVGTKRECKQFVSTLKRIGKNLTKHWFC